MVVWLAEQLVSVEFEFLSISYVFSVGMLMTFYSALESNSGKEKTDVQQNFECGHAEMFQKDEIDLVAETKRPEPEEIHFEAHLELRENKKDNRNKKEELYQLVTQRIVKGALEELSARKLEVLLMILENKKRKSIAEEMEITENTVKKHTSHIFSKLGATNRNLEQALKDYIVECSNERQFQFQIRCEHCGFIWKSMPISFSHADVIPKTEGKRVIYQVLYQKEKEKAYNHCCCRWFGSTDIIVLISALKVYHIDLK